MRLRASGARQRIRGLGLVAAFILFLLLGAATTPAAAFIAFGLTTENWIGVFYTSDPSSPLAGRAILGLQPGEQALAIDVRPATGEVYLLGSTSRLYIVDPGSGQATAVGTPFTPALAGSSFGFDFNPATDRISVIGDTGQRLQLSPDTGAVVAIEPPLVAATSRIVASAYSRNFAGATATTLYVIDSQTDRLLLQDPSGPTDFFVVGPLGVDTADLVGFDITANDGIAFAALNVGTSKLYTIDLATGAATLVGDLVGFGPPFPIGHPRPPASFRDVAVLSRGVPMVALRGGTELVRFHSARPETLLGAGQISGVQPGEILVGIDVRFSDGELYGVGSTSRLYRLNPFTAAATQVGPVFTMPLSGTRFGVEFDANDRLRILSDAGQNLQIDPAAGAVTVLPDLAPGMAVTGIACPDRWITVHGIDAATDTLRSGNDFGSPAPLGVDASPDVGFDISLLDTLGPLYDVGYAALSVGGLSGLYSIDLRSGRATRIAVIGGGAIVDGLAVLSSPAYSFAEGATGTFFDTDLLLLNPAATPVPVTVTYVTENARIVRDSVTLPPRSHTTIAADANASLGETAFASAVTSPAGTPIVVERTMRWGDTGYGMHTERASAGPAERWLFAEGAQGFYDTYFLLANAGLLQVAVEVRFHIENGPLVRKVYQIPAHSRLTVYAGAIPELTHRAFATEMTSFGGAITAERAMYFGRPLFAGGHASAGVSGGATSWFFAEGATGSFFTTFLLLFNPNDAPATVTVGYFREGGGSIGRTTTLPPMSRQTINLALVDPLLAAGSVAMTVRSDVGVVAERTMYWPSAPPAWQEAHNAFGVTDMAPRWGIADGRVGGPSAYQTFVLLANFGEEDALVTLTFVRAGRPPVVKSVVVRAQSRLTIGTGAGGPIPELADESFGVVVGANRPITAERSLYADVQGVRWGAGSCAAATPLP